MKIIRFNILLDHPVLAAIFSQQTLQKWQKIVQWPTQPSLSLLLFGPFPIKKTLLFPYDHLDTTSNDDDC